MKNDYITGIDTDPNGTVYVGARNHFGDYAIEKSDTDPSPTIAIKTSFGTIVASICGDAGIYDEIGLDLVSPDGRTLQLATIGATEPDEESDTDAEMHVYVWNGTDEECEHEHTITVNDESYWY